MKIMYVAPRYHTNQIPIVEGWINAEDTVTFVAQYQAKTEDYTAIQPIILGYSCIFRIAYWILKKLEHVSHNKIIIPFMFQALFGFPNLFKVNKIIKENRPDGIIVRERCLYSAAFTQLARLYSIPCILYNQTPYYEIEEKQDLAHKVIRGLNPKHRMTPVYGIEDNGSKLHKCVYYVPFVMQPKIQPENKGHFKNQQIHIVCVGKFENRKHHKMLVNVMYQLNQSKDLKMTLVGEATADSHKQYLKELKELITKHNLEDSVSLLVNVSREVVFNIYEEADLFVLPSSDEFASISQLEAMACSLPIICSDSNGTSCYIINGENGYTFQNLSEEDLLCKVKMCVQDKDKLIKMGVKSYEYVVGKHNFETYKKSIMEIVKNIEMTCKA